LLLYPVREGIWVAGWSPKTRWYRRGASTPTRVIAVLAVDEPISVMPRHVLEANNLAVNFDLPDWVGKSIPSWRGIPCQLGIASFFDINLYRRTKFGNEVAPPLSVLVRIPEYDPPAPPKTILLGNEFLHKYQCQIQIRYSTLNLHSWPNCACGEVLVP
jgi:hypothetical protein